ncbi:hypothetical protein IYQ_17869 [Aeromonas salmonicida subsp. salmonicida 01-B526]|uniref:Uncharacterized protein n=1 Tax=Aeromonas salmonicida subsp. salmonicida 01-B526 TaxID=1076135 RepID=A0ABN0DW08_AERSS|nr:hypothetical protein IYQ_17869 [Aeromonas salmonicida subsp. salmonicida 01-B526]
MQDLLQRLRLDAITAKHLLCLVGSKRWLVSAEISTKIYINTSTYLIKNMQFDL